MYLIRSTAALLLTALAVLPGCYRYTAVRPAEVVPGTHVRAWVTLEQADRLELNSTLLTERPMVEGSVVEISPTSLEVLARVRQPDPFASDAPLNQRFTISLQGLRELEIRSLDRTRTYLGVGAGTALVAAVLWWQTTGWFGGNTEDVPIDKI